jgi:hypothetical protein
MKQRFYYDGKRQKTSSEKDVTILRKWLDNLQADWSRNLAPIVQPGEFDPNNGSEVRRVSEDELYVITTGGHHLRWVNV